jgi:hypothetical protein
MLTDVIDRLNSRLAVLLPHAELNWEEEEIGIIPI